MCKDLLSTEGGAPVTLTQGFTWSILLLMSAPYLLVGSITALIFLSIRRANRRASS